MGSWNLPEDLLIEILTRLPVKSLMRFRCVCKSWCALFTNPSFITTHFNHDHNNVRSLVKRLSKRRKNNIFYSFPSESLDQPSMTLMKLNFHLPERLQILGPINGLFCLCEDGNTFNPSHFFLGLWNPATREFRELPISPLGLLPQTIERVIVGFGLDTKTNDYKVVKITEFEEFTVIPRPFPPAEVYSLSSDSWRVIDDSVLGFLCPEPSFTYADGFYHWRAFDHYGEHFIVSFDMTNETFHRTPNTKFADWLTVMTTLNGSLAMISYANGPTKTLCDVWVMKEYGIEESWTHEYRIGPVPGVLSPLCFRKNGELLLENHTGQLVRYSSSTREVKELGIRGIRLQALLYKESLVSVKGGNQL